MEKTSFERADLRGMDAAKTIPAPNKEGMVDGPRQGRDSLSK